MFQDNEDVKKFEGELDVCLFTGKHLSILKRRCGIPFLTPSRSCHLINVVDPCKTHGLGCRGVHVRREGSHEYQGGRERRQFASLATEPRCCGVHEALMSHQGLSHGCIRHPHHTL
ncbi:hypothetical protein J6590_025475 [Homalodisca vitripennis]|nr:hypothetical protein J6590_025475 [Homalodisca vitripennis]